MINAAEVINVVAYDIASPSSVAVFSRLVFNTFPVEDNIALVNIDLSDSDKKYGDNPGIPFISPSLSPSSFFLNSSFLVHLSFFSFFL